MGLYGAGVRSPNELTDAPGALGALLARGDDEPGGDVAQAHLLPTQVEAMESMWSSMTPAPPMVLPRS